MKCQYCGEENREGSRFCSSCGKDLVQEVKNVCPNCGEELEEDSIFCINCGTQVQKMQSRNTNKVNMPKLENVSGKINIPSMENIRDKVNIPKLEELPKIPAGGFSREVIGLIIAGIGQICASIMMKLSNSSAYDNITPLLMMAGISLGLVGFFLIGNIKHSLGVLKKVFFFGWLVAPFPASIIAGTVVMVVVVFAVMFGPIILPAINFIGYLRERNS